MNLPIRDIRHSLGRFVFTAIGIGMLLMIVMGMGGIYRGIVEDATLLVDSIGADLWVVQHGTRGPFAAVSRVPENLADRVASVAAAVPEMWTSAMSTRRCWTSLPGRPTGFRR
jgi:putative ABC transport system permease protein